MLTRVNRPEDAIKVAHELDYKSSDWWIGIHGHVHKQRIFEYRSNNVVEIHAGEGSCVIHPDRKYIVCPGSVGVSRDLDSRSAYMIIDDTGTITMKRVEYDWRISAKKIRDAGLETQLFIRKHTYLIRQLRKIFGNIVKGFKSMAFTMISIK
jgi:diadenosine tetraphosphatase ApaH/serine/threonine PP2A family protein phosphatase